MQQLNCKIGDLAIAVNAQLTENLGNLVEVIGLKSKDGPDLTGPGHIWNARTVSGRATLFYRYVKEGGRIERFSEGPVPDCRLRPVSALPDSDAVREDVGVGQTESGRKRKPRVVVEAT